MSPDPKANSDRPTDAAVPPVDSKATRRSGETKRPVPVAKRSAPPDRKITADQYDALLGALDALVEEDKLADCRSALKEMAALVTDADLAQAYEKFKGFPRHTVENRSGFIRDSLQTIASVFSIYSPTRNRRKSFAGINIETSLKTEAQNVLSAHGARLDQLHSGRESSEELPVIVDYKNDPITTSRFWKPRPPGRPSKNANYDEELFAFIRMIYRPYIEAGRSDEVRAFILENDRRLYEAIGSYEKNSDTRNLPADIAMPSRTVKVAERLQRAAHEGLSRLSKSDRMSVTARIRRLDAKNQI